MNFTTFIDFLNCLFIDEVEAVTKSNNQERFARMVFEGSFDAEETDPLLRESHRRQAMRSGFFFLNLNLFTNDRHLRTARCVKIMGKGVVKVVRRCDDAKENSNLGECSLTG